MKLGRLPVKKDVRTLLLANYLHHPTLPPAPEAVDFTAGITEWGMMANDRLGDCTCAAIGHLIMAWTALEKRERVISDADIIKAYSDFTGYNPDDPSTDRGGVELDILNDWRKTGVAGDKLGAFVSIHPRNLGLVRVGCNMFTGLYTGVALPITAQTQDVWHVDHSVPENAQPGSWGGHAVPVVAYDAKGLTVVTWGQLKRMTWTFWQAYVQEAYACLSPDYIAGDKDPAGFSLELLQADLAALAA